MSFLGVGEWSIYDQTKNLIPFLRPDQRLHQCPVSDLSQRPANSHSVSVSLAIFCHLSRSHDKAPIRMVFGEKSF